MGEHDVDRSVDEEGLREFSRALLADLSALEILLERGGIESGVRRIGAEQEMFLVDSACRPAPIGPELLEQLREPMLTTEIGRFNLEANLPPLLFGGSCLSEMESGIQGLLHTARAAAQEQGCDIVLVGILPTLRKADLTLANMAPNPRYFELNRVVQRLRGGDLHLLIKGIDELDIKHDNVMLESVNTSFQVHFQVGAEEFAHFYNLAQLATPPMLAAAVNSPLLLGKKLWKETRIAVFQHSVDVRSSARSQRGHRPRVHYGESWVHQGVVELFKEDIARYRVLLAHQVEEDPLAVLEAGGVPNLQALRLHNGTVYRWNRACYGVHDGQAHLRIENRVIPSGPTVQDEVANAAFFFGLVSGLADVYDDITSRMQFEDVKNNFLQAARQGLKAQFNWLDGHSFTARDLILSELLPVARSGLASSGIAGQDIERYLGLIEVRVQSGRTGAQWQLDSCANMGESVTRDRRQRALTRSILHNQWQGRPGHEWPLVEAPDDEDWRHSYRTVGQYMTTDLFTVRPGDIVDLAVSLMDWEHVRHVPVEDDDGRLVGILSHRRILRLIGKRSREGAQGSTATVPVEAIMKPDPLHVPPETPTLDAIQIMKEHRVGCLPIVENDRLVGIITERDLVDVAARLLEESLRDA
jgi:CBS domain-containing protein